MPTYKRIDGPAQLAEACASPESYQLDFKRDADPAEWWELAKDIAAFANHVGGVILVGAAEQPGGGAMPSGIPADRAEEVTRAYENAARDRCRPRPTVASSTIQVDGGRVVAAVNVDPVPDQLVGAMFYRTAQNGARVAADDAWRFYVRTGAHNIAISPERLPMFMSAAVRRTIIRLESIPADAKVCVLWRRARHNVHQSEPQKKEVPPQHRELDVEANVFRFEDHTTHAATKMHVPLDDIEVVWLGPDGVWCIRVVGEFSTDGRPGYISNPSNTDWRVA